MTFQSYPMTLMNTLFCPRPKPQIEGRYTTGYIKYIMKHTQGTLIATPVPLHIHTIIQIMWQQQHNTKKTMQIQV